MTVSNDDPAAVLARFVSGLKDIWIKAGPPTFHEVETLSRKFATPVQARTLRVEELKRSTTQRILSGQGKTMPKWPWVASLVTVLRVIACQNGVDPADLGTLEEWKAGYEESWRLFHEIPEEEPSAIDEPAGSAQSAPDVRHAPSRASRIPVAAGAHQAADRTVRRAIRRSPGSRVREGDQESGRAALDALARRFRTAGWWHPYRDVVPEFVELYLELEQAARLIQSYESQFVPGLLQTPGYAEAVIRLEHSAAPETQIERRVELRMLRQKRLWGPNPPRLWVILDETVLRRGFGGTATMRAQLEHLIAVSTRPNIGIQVMPVSKGDMLRPVGRSPPCASPRRDCPT